jgi:hypothetical protein
VYLSRHNISILPKEFGRTWKNLANLYLDNGAVSFIEEGFGISTFLSPPLALILSFVPF